jgi:site-specific DNA recombinase
MRSTDRLGCVAHREKSTCANRRTVKLADLEQRVLSGLKDRMLTSELYDEFVKEFHAELERVNSTNADSGMALEKRLSEVSIKIGRIVEAITEGTASNSLTTKLTELENLKVETESELQSITDRPEIIKLPTNLPEIYHQQIAQLESKIRIPSATNDAAKQILRSFVDKIVVYPGPGRGITEIEVFGSLADILAAANSPNEEAAYHRSVAKVVPRGGIEPPTP